jgi:hypothetical protein
LWEFTFWNQRLETRYALSPARSFSHSSLISYLCDWNHCCVPAWHASPSIDKVASSSHRIIFHCDSSSCLASSEPCFECPLFVYRLSTRGSICFFSLALLSTHPPAPQPLSGSDQRDEYTTEQDKDREISIANAITGSRLCLFHKDFPTG